MPVSIYSPIDWIFGADYGAKVAVSNVAITSGCNQAYCVAVSALAGPGDEVILPVPYLSCGGDRLQ